MKIAVTGATGFVGSHLIRHLSLSGHTITAYGRTKNPPKILKKYAKYIFWDINSDSLPEEYDGDVIIHTAGFVEFWGSYEEMYKTNVQGTAKALTLAKQVKHFIYISTASIYDSFVDKQYVSENIEYPNQYANSYAKTKADAERIIIKSAKMFKKVTIIRPHTIYGPGDRTVIPKILQSIRYDKALIVGNGENKFSITHIGNICYGISLVINAHKKGLKIYNMTDSKVHSINDIYSCLFTTCRMRVEKIHIPYFLALPLAMLLENIYSIIHSKTAPLITADIARQFTQESTLSLRKITSELGYKPPFSYKEGFADIKVYIDSVGGVESYLKNCKNSWAGKLFTY